MTFQTLGWTVDWPQIATEVQKSQAEWKQRMTPCCVMEAWPYPEPHSEWDHPTTTDLSYVRNDDLEKGYFANVAKLIRKKKYISALGATVSPKWIGGSSDVFVLYTGYVFKKYKRNYWSVHTESLIYTILNMVTPSQVPRLISVTQNGIVMERGSTLSKQQLKSKKMWLNMLLQIANALSYLQECLSFIHGDLLFKNILFWHVEGKLVNYGKGRLRHNKGILFKICDFGLSSITYKDVHVSTLCDQWPRLHTVKMPHSQDLFFLITHLCANNLVNSSGVLQLTKTFLHPDGETKNILELLEGVDSIYHLCITKDNPKTYPESVVDWTIKQCMFET